MQFTAQLGQTDLSGGSLLGLSEARRHATEVGDSPLLCLP